MIRQALSAPQCGANRKLSAPQCGADQILFAPQCGANQILSAPHLDCQRYKGEIQEEGQRDSFASKNNVENTYTIANTKSRGPKTSGLPKVAQSFRCNSISLQLPCFGGSFKNTLNILCLANYQILNSLEILVECDPPILSLRRLQALQGSSEEQMAIPRCYLRVGANSSGRGCNPREGMGRTENQSPAPHEQLSYQRYD